MHQWIESIQQLVWSWPMLLFVGCTGVYLTFTLRGFQFRYLAYGLRLALVSKRDSDQEGDISHFKALMTSLAGAVGTGSIVGMAVAVTKGGLGALFWMWITALIGMATKFAEAALAVEYRTVDHRGEMCGGPMYYIERGIGSKALAVAFALFGACASIGTGNLVQVNSVADAVNLVWGVNPWIVGVILSAVTGLVLMGGVRSIGMVAGILVPVMASIYIAGGVLILLLNAAAIPAALQSIVSSAFGYDAVIGGALGSGLLIAVQMGVSKGVFTNEAGLGISSIAAAAAKTDIPGRQAVVAMTGTFLSTLVICTITGLVLAVSGVLEGVEGVDGAQLSIRAFGRGVWGGQYIATIGLILFAYSTVLGWAYYGEKCCEYLFGEGSIWLYRLGFSLVIIPGAAIDLQLVWDIADITNGLMIIPNLIGLILLAPVVKRLAGDLVDAVRRES